MKKHWMILIAAVALSGACKDNKQDAGLATISGTWDRQGSEEIALFYIVSGRLEPQATYRLGDDKKFAFALSPEQEGLYVIGGGTALSGKNNKYTFYFKPGDRVTIAVNDSTYALVGANTKENQALTDWHDYILPLERMAHYDFRKTYVEFFPLLDEKTAKPYEAAATGNRTFDRLFSDYRTFDLLLNAAMFTLTPRTAHPQNEDFTDFYRRMNLDDIGTTTAILSYPYGVRLLNSTYFVVNRLQSPGAPADFREHIALVKNDTLKGEIVLDRLDNLNDYMELEEMKATYGRYILTPDQKARLDAETARLSQAYIDAGIGKPAVNFTHKDRNGKDISLSAFKGKVVYVDIWATWCGPCRREIPSLKALEQKFHGKNMAFIGVSIDEAKDKDKWLAFLDKEQLPGVQLFGGNGWNSDIAKFYHVKSIPRFLLIDKDGNLVSAEAPRPSDPRLENLLNKLLK